MTISRSICELSAIDEHLWGEDGMLAGMTRHVNVRKPPAAVPIAVVLLASAVMHLVRPPVFEAAIPNWMRGSRRAWVQVSGVAELLIGLGLLHPSTRKLSGLAAVALFVAVFPANIQMLQNVRSTGEKTVLTARLPLQLPLIAQGLRIFRG